MNDTESFVSVGLDSVAAEGDVDAEWVAEVSENSIFDNLPRQELYNSATTHHISPHREDSENYKELLPKFFTAANKQKFSAVATGKLVVDVPNGVNTSSLRLMEVLYSREVGYTLVSISKLDDCVYSATFKKGQCIIRDADDEMVGQVPKVGKGLYRVFHDDRSAVADEATYPYGVSSTHGPATAQKLVERGFVTGVKLDVSGGEPMFCESCVYAKSTRKPVSKISEGERAKELGDEIHSDLWGPAPTAMLGGRKYYIMFTDDETGTDKAGTDKALLVAQGFSQVSGVDCTIASTSKELVIELKAKVREHVEITDLGQLHWLLGIDVKRDLEAKSIHMSQCLYTTSKTLNPLLLLWTLRYVYHPLSLHQPPRIMQQCATYLIVRPLDPFTRHWT